MKNQKIVFIVLGCIVVGVLLYIGIHLLTATKTVNNNIEESQELVKRDTAQMIINQVDYAYHMATMENNGEYPTLEQVKLYFMMENAVWVNDYMIESEYCNCDVQVIDNELKVICLGIETMPGLILSNVNEEGY